MKYKKIIEHYEECFKKFGDTPQGVDWTKDEQVEFRYNTMIELINFREKSFHITENVSLLDYGCGLSHLYEYIVKNNIDYVEYTGLEISNKFFEVSRKKFPDNKYIKGDILKDGDLLKNYYDYIIMNGVFTEKRDLSYQDMFVYFEKMIEKIY